MIVLDSGGCALKLAVCAIMQPEGRSDCFDKMLRFDSSRLSVHPVEPRAAGTLPPTVRPKGHRLSVTLILAMNEPLKPFMVGPPAGTVSKNNRMARRKCAHD